MLRQTQSNVISCLEDVLRLIKSHRFLLSERSNQKKIASRHAVSVHLFLKLSEFLTLCDRQAVIQPSKVNAEALIAAASALSNFFTEYISRLPVQPDWEQLALRNCFLDFSFTLSNSLICPDRVILDDARSELRDQADEEKRLRERARRVSELIDIHTDLAEEDKEMGLEDAVLVIQKLERVYQAISRFNYLRHVYQRAMDIRLDSEKKTLTDEEAIVRIQARTRGYFARKRVRQMRQKELDLLGLSATALIESMRLNVVISDNLPSVATPVKTLESLLEELKDNYFPAAVPEKEGFRVLQRKADTEDVYFELCLCRLIRETKKPRLLLNELVSHKVPMFIEGRTFPFDLRLYLTCSFLIPLALRGWNIPTQKRRILLVGEEGSGKTAWTEAVAASTGAVHLRLSAAALVRQRRRLVKSVVKNCRADPCVLVSVDRLEIFKTSKRTTTASQNLLKVLLTELQETNVFLLGMTRTDQLQPAILSMFSDVVRLSAPPETQKLEVIARFLVKMDDAGRLPKVPENLGKLRKEAAGRSCGSTGKVVRSHCSRGPANNRTD